MRKAHLNDLENVVPFVLLGLLYVATDPKPSVALWHYRVSKKITTLLAVVLEKVSYQQNKNFVKIVSGVENIFVVKKRFSHILL